MLKKTKELFLYTKDFFEDTAENIKETVVTAVDSAKLQYKITNQRNELNALYASLGKISIQMSEGTATTKPKIKAADKGTSENGQNKTDGKRTAEKPKIVSEKEDVAEKLKNRAAQKEEILDGLQNQLRIVAGKVICPSCGRFMSDKFLFCPWCGRHINQSFDYDTDSADVSSEELDNIREIDEL